jgi:hypothetical protein
LFIAGQVGGISHHQLGGLANPAKRRWLKGAFTIFG